MLCFSFHPGLFCPFVGKLSDGLDALPSVFGLDHDGVYGHVVADDPEDSMADVRVCDVQVYGPWEVLYCVSWRYGCSCGGFFDDVAEFSLG